MERCKPFALPTPWLPKAQVCLPRFGFSCSSMALGALKGSLSLAVTLLTRKPRTARSFVLLTPGTGPKRDPFPLTDDLPLCINRNPEASFEKRVRSSAAVRRRERCRERCRRGGRARRECGTASPFVYHCFFCPNIPLFFLPIIGTRVSACII